jgi:hypothetical protein
MGALIPIIEGIISLAPQAVALWGQLRPIIVGGVSNVPAPAQQPILDAVQAIIADTPEALALWQAVSPVLVSGQEPTPAEWAALNAMADAAHTAGPTSPSP